MAKNGGPQKMDVTPTPEALKAEITVEQKRKMFADYDSAHERALAAQIEADKVKAAEGVFVQAIIEKLGNGPFLYKGRQLTAVVRNNKDGSQTYFFKGPNQSEVQEI